ncbi:hypothetical protein BG015_002764, partial [Linnemannia schmuckeri]
YFASSLPSTHKHIKPTIITSSSHLHQKIPMSCTSTTNQRTGADTLVASVFFSHLSCIFKNGTPSTLSERYKTATPTPSPSNSHHSLIVGHVDSSNINFINETPFNMSGRYKTAAAPPSNGDHLPLIIINESPYMRCEKCKNQNMADWCLECKYCEDCCLGYEESIHS